MAEPYRYQLELHKKDTGELLGRVEFAPDFAPAREAVALEIVRRERGAQPMVAWEIAVEPVWEGSGPHIRGIRLTPAGGSLSMVFSLTYFADAARKASSVFVQSGQLKAGDLYEFGVLAEESIPVRSLRRFAIQQARTVLPIEQGDLAELRAGAVRMGKEQEGELPVFVSWRVLDEASRLTRQSAPMEAGGVLVGRLLRDGAEGDLFVEVTAQIPAHAKAQQTKLSFTPETWQQLQVDLDHRAQGELWLGWWHSHAWQWDPQIAAESEGDPSYLSADDLRLHRTVFSRAFTVALLVTDAPSTGISWNLFGWRKGAIAARAFYVTDLPFGEPLKTKGVANAQIFAGNSQ